MLRAIFRTFILLILLACSIFVFIWYHLSNASDGWISKLPNDLRFQYQYLSLDKDGSIVFDSPKITNLNGNVLFEAKDLIYTPESWLDYIDLRENLALDQYPADGSFKASGLLIDIENLSKQYPKPSDTKFLKLLALACGSKTDFSLSDIMNNNVSSLSGKLKVKYRYNSLNSELKLESSIDLNSFIGLEVRVDLNDVNPILSSSPYLAYSQWVFFDTSFLNMKNVYCSKLNNEKVDTYLIRHVNAVRKEVGDKGLDLSPLFIEQYSRFIKNPENMAFSFSPKTGVHLNDLSNLSYFEIVNELGMAINMNGRSTLEIANSKKSKVIKPESNVEKDTTEVVTKVTAKLKNLIIEKPNKYELAKLVDKSITLKMNDGKKYQGRIVKVKDNAILFDLISNRGSATLSIKIDNLFEVEVER